MFSVFIVMVMNMQVPDLEYSLESLEQEDNTLGVLAAFVIY